ncbi:2-oxo-4-hydroxy-4-carboxy-5-ureidoimidazoline decarboxylase [Marinomonas epiphytica]
MSSENFLQKMNQKEFIETFAGVYEHSTWVAEQLWRAHCEHPTGYLSSIEKVTEQMQAIVNNSSQEQKLILLRAHPDLAGKAAIAGDLTKESKAEQAGVGLDQCSEEEFAYFLQLNNRYREKFGFPFIMAVKGATKDQVIAGFETRTDNDWQGEFDTAMAEVHKIAAFRLADI